MVTPIPPGVNTLGDKLSEIETGPLSPALEMKEARESRFPKRINERFPHRGKPGRETATTSSESGAPSSSHLYLSLEKFPPARRALGTCAPESIIAPPPPQDEEAQSAFGGGGGVFKACLPSSPHVAPFAPSSTIISKFSGTASSPFPDRPRSPLGFLSGVIGDRLVGVHSRIPSRGTLVAFLPSTKSSQGQCHIGVSGHLRGMAVGGITHERSPSSGKR